MHIKTVVLAGVIISMLVVGIIVFTYLERTAQVSNTTAQENL